MAQESHSRRYFIPLVVLSMLLVTGASRAAGAEAGLAPAMDYCFCDDGDACTTDSCADPSTGRCAHAPRVCDDANPCTLDSCDAATGCVPTPLPVGTACDDGNACTAGDACDASARCAGTDEPAGLPCDDLNGCTSADACNGAGTCLGVPQLPGSPCDDGLACTTGDACAQDPAGVMTCRATPMTCDDGDLCTEDVCDPATGECVARPANCDDGSECTVDSCTSAAGCQHRSRAGEHCEDGNACTLDEYLYCDIGRLYCVKSGRRKVCDDRNMCTYDLCRPDTGCDYIPLPRDCNDGNACTTGDICGNTGTCSGAPVTCDDGNAGTIDSCDPATGSCRNILVCDGEDGGGSLMGAPTISFKSPLGKGSGTAQWTTRCETALVGFNVVTIDGDGVRTQLNNTTIPCESCLAGGRQEYSSPVPKHKSGRNIFVEVLHIGGRIETLGPAVRE